MLAKEIIKLIWEILKLIGLVAVLIFALIAIFGGKLWT